MEMRSLARCLRSGPTTSLYAKQPSILLRGQFLNGAQSLRYSSSDNGPSKPPPSNSQTEQRPSSPSKSPFGTRPNRTQQQQQQTPNPASRPRQSATSDYDEILDKLDFGSRKPRASSDGGDPAASLSRAVGHSAGTDSYRQPVRRVDLKLGPSLGRQVQVEPEKGFDLASAMRALGSACAQNRVPQQQRAQKFHIRRGQLRKNLRMERWRKMFKFSFRHTVGKIQRMRSQGW